VTSSLIAALEHCLPNNPIPHPFHGVVKICMVSVDFYDGHCCKVQAIKKSWIRVRKIVLTQYFGKICQILGIFSFTTNCVYFCFFTENIFHTFPPKLTFSKNNEPNVKFHVKCCRNTVFYGIYLWKNIVVAEISGETT